MYIEPLGAKKTEMNFQVSTVILSPPSKYLRRYPDTYIGSYGTKPETKSFIPCVRYLGACSYNK